MNEILQSILTEVKILREEVLSLKGQLEVKVAEEEAFANEKERIEAIGYIPKAEAAAFLLISTRSICRYITQPALKTAAPLIAFDRKNISNICCCHKNTVIL